MQSLLKHECEINNFYGDLNIKNHVVKHNNWIRIKKEGIENTCVEKNLAPEVEIPAGECF